MRRTSAAQGRAILQCGSCRTASRNRSAAGQTATRRRKLLPFLLRPQRQRHAQDAEYQRIGNQEQLADPIVFRLIVIQPQAAHAERKQQPEQFSSRQCCQMLIARIPMESRR